MKTKLLSVVLIFSVLILSFITVSAENNKNFSLTDPATDLSYGVVINGKNLSVMLGAETIGETIIQDISTCTIYNNVLNAYYADNLNKALLVYCFDFYNDQIDSFAINENAFYNENCFSADGDRFFFVSGGDTRKLCVYKDGLLEKFDFKAQIKEILLIEQGLVIIITTEQTFIYNNSEIITSNYTLSPHIKYTGEGVVTDSLDKEFYIDNGNLVEITPAISSTAVTETQADIPVELSNGFFISQEGITVSKIKKAFADLEITKFAKADGTIINNGKLGTGANFTLSSGEVITVIIFGELTGEGNINSRDLKAILNHLSGKELLNGANLIAADVNEDTAVTTKDALLIAQMY